jgi:hypothetical protein
MNGLVQRALSSLGYTRTRHQYFSSIPEQLGKAEPADYLGRFREIVSDPLNLLIERVPHAGYLDADGHVVLHNGHRVSLSGPNAYYDQFSDILMINRGVHEPLEEYTFQEFLRTVRGQRVIMIELGAYWAHYSMWLKRACRNAICIMVEPDAQKLDVGRENFARHGYDGEFINAGVTDDGFRLDAFAKDRDLARIDVLHCDIQGFETALIEHARTLFQQRRIGAAFISTHNESIHRTIAACIGDLAYRIEVSSPYDAHTTSHDGFIFATSPDREPVFTGFAPLGRLAINNATATELADYVDAVRAARNHRH